MSPGNLGWGNLKSMTHFFLLPVVTADILEQGNDTVLKRSYRINITEVNPTLPSYPLPSKSQAVQSALAKGIRCFLETSNFYEKLRSYSFYPSHHRYSSFPGRSPKSIMFTHPRIGIAVVMR